MDQIYHNPLVIAQGFKGQVHRFKIAIQINGEYGTIVYTAPDEKGATTSTSVSISNAAAIIVSELDNCDLFWPLEFRMFNTQENTETLHVKCEEYVLDILLERELDYCHVHDVVHPVLDHDCPLCEVADLAQLEELYAAGVGTSQPETGVSG